MPYRGPINDTVENILGGVRSSATYIGARRLKDIRKILAPYQRTEFTKHLL